MILAVINIGIILAAAILGAVVGLFQSRDWGIEGRIIHCIMSAVIGICVLGGIIILFTVVLR